MTKIQIPPIKCQGIKSKLVSFIKEHVAWQHNGIWIEPFCGSGVVGFNIRPKHAIFADTNPHIIAFYQHINQEKITPMQVRAFLVQEGKKLTEHSQVYYYQVRERFNESYAPLDFLFLNRACFNGLIRFNRHGKFNVPFNHKPNRFSKAYITKIVNQVEAVYKLCKMHDWQFVCQDFAETIGMVSKHDFVYCDPPYIGRNADYFNQWDESHELKLFEMLSTCPANFILSTWHSNQYRHNEYITDYWNQFHITLREHFYHVGAKETNRHPILEAIVTNYQAISSMNTCDVSQHQARLFENETNYL